MIEYPKCSSFKCLRRPDHLQTTLILDKNNKCAPSKYSTGLELGPLPALTGIGYMAYLCVIEIAIEITTRMTKPEGRDLTRRDYVSTTPLIWAFEYGSYTVAKLLLGWRISIPIHRMTTAEHYSLLLPGLGMRV